MARLGCLLASILLVVALPGCGQQPATATPLPAITVASAGLSIVAIDGPASKQKGRIRCPLWLDRKDQVVLGSDPLSLTGDRVAQLKRQWTEFDSGRTTGLPDALRQVPGAPSGPPMPRPPQYSDYGGTNFYWGPGCALELQITNTGVNRVLISSAGFRLAEPSIVNAQHYNLVDRCSLEGTPPENCAAQLGGRPTFCGIYSAQVRLAPGAAGNAYRDSPLSTDQNGPCPPMTIEPGSTKELWIQAVGAVAQIYDVVPELVVGTSSGTSTVTLPQLAGTAAFADPPQFSCYKLAGTSFVKAADGSAAASEPRAGRDWCV